MDSLVIYPLKHIIPKEKNGTGFHFPYKPNFTIFIPENEATLIWFTLFIGKIMLIFQGIKSIFLWLKADWYEWFVWGRTSGFQKNHRGICVWLLLGNSLMFCLPILVLSVLARQVCLKAHFLLLPPSSSREGEPFGALQLWTADFPYHKKIEGFLWSTALEHTSPLLIAGGEEPKPENVLRIQSTDYSLFICLFLIQGIYFVPFYLRCARGGWFFYVNALEETAETWYILKMLRLSF